MASFRVALSNLSFIRVSGVRNNFDIDELPISISAAHLPALLVLPLELEKERLFKERKDSLQSVTFSGNAKSVYFLLTHLLLVTPTDRGLGLRGHLPRLVGLIDNYVAAIAADITLGESLLVPARVAVEAGVFTYDESDFYGCAFRHTWMMEI